MERKMDVYRFVDLIWFDSILLSFGCTHELDLYRKREYKCNYL